MIHWRVAAGIFVGVVWLGVLGNVDGSAEDSNGVVQGWGVGTGSG